VLARWWGHQRARRDFAADGIAIEVKTTSQNSRQHFIGSIEQLDPQSPGESVYVYSLGVKTDMSAGKKLPHFVADVEAQLVTAHGEPDEDARVRFWQQLMSYGYDKGLESFYLGAPGYLKPHLPGALYKESALARLQYESFVGGTLPSMVRSVAYTLEITAESLSDAEAESVLEQLILSAAITYQ
jgi:hypothetical protein